MKEKIQTLVIESLRELAEDADLPTLSDPKPDTVLYGNESPLDSMGLVTLIADIEGRVAEAFDQDIILADERAMSRSRSPFRTVETLTAYIEELLSEGDA